MTLRSNEVRIGNYVQDLLGTIYKVDIIGHPDNSDYIHASHEKGRGQNGFYGIPISNDIIINNCGFNTEYKAGWIGIDVKKEGQTTTDFILATPLNMGEWQNFYAFVYDEYRFVQLDYLHELQNIYKEICKQELIIKDICN